PRLFAYLAPEAKFRKISDTERELSLGFESAPILKNPFFNKGIVSFPHPAQTSIQDLLGSIGTKRELIAGQSFERGNGVLTAWQFLMVRLRNRSATIIPSLGISGEMAALLEGNWSMFGLHVPFPQEQTSGSNYGALIDGHTTVTIGASVTIGVDEWRRYDRQLLSAVLLKAENVKLSEEGRQLKLSFSYNLSPSEVIEVSLVGAMSISGDVIVWSGSQTPGLGNPGTVMIWTRELLPTQVTTTKTTPYQFMYTTMVAAPLGCPTCNQYGPSSRGSLPNGLTQNPLIAGSDPWLFLISHGYDVKTFTGMKLGGQKLIFEAKETHLSFNFSGDPSVDKLYIDLFPTPDYRFGVFRICQSNYCVPTLGVVLERFQASFIFSDFDGDGFGKQYEGGLSFNCNPDTGANSPGLEKDACPCRISLDNSCPDTP
ncbi:MAG: hypothetical protein KC609_00570, partial [Myxococcales bacterium]|nr:hypothetical protein [Myxococcales bacterium]